MQCQEWRPPARVYFARHHATGLIKIGASSKPATRIQTLRWTLKTPITLLGSIPGGQDIEREWHTRFARHRAGGEWFYPVPSLLAAIEATLTTPETEHQATHDRVRAEQLETAVAEWRARQAVHTTSLEEIRRYWAMQGGGTQ